MLKSLRHYNSELNTGIDWLRSSIRKEGGSSAFFAPGFGWSKAYPETTGYLISTFIEYSKNNCDPSAAETARQLGKWLMSIQDTEGYWKGGLFPYRASARPSVFNTGQILEGLTSLYEEERDEACLEAILKSAKWLSENVNAQGIWETGHYLDEYQPVYYTRVAWPMLKAWKITGNDALKDSAVRVLNWAMSKRQENGAFSDWGFDADTPAYTHTIAYTIRGFIESSLILNSWSEYGAPVVLTLEKIRKHAEINGSKVAGKYDTDWQRWNGFYCVTGACQLSICYLLLENEFEDLRLVNTAAKLIDSASKARHGVGMILGKGGIPGSVPFWGEYMRFRYPNWAMKFYVDALMQLVVRLQKEVKSIDES